MLVKIRFTFKKTSFLWYLVEMSNRTRRTCHVQERQLCLSYFWRYFPLLYLTVIIQWFRVPLCKSKTLWNIFMILGRNVEQDQTTCRIQEWQLCLSYFWCYLPLLCLTETLELHPFNRSFKIIITYYHPMEALIYALLLIGISDNLSSKYIAIFVAPHVKVNVFIVPHR